ncbi:MAG: serine hydrolase [bacterium]|nr:serine hydrolase [bacterium]
MFDRLFSFVRRHRGVALPIILLLTVCVSIEAREWPTAAPEDAGMSSARLDRLDRYIQKAIDDQQVAGAVALIARGGSIVHHRAFGMQDADEKIPMKTDSMFRIASMSKAITTMAVMMLYEEGAFFLNDPVSKYIPEFADMKVLVENPGGGYRLVDAEQPITIRHLLTHTSGITYRFMKRPYLAEMYKENNIHNGMVPLDETIGDMVKRLAKLPLYCQPGSKWEYGLNTDVLGYLVQVVSGKTLGEFCKERIFTPLGMNDTTFYVTPEQRKRLAAVYEPDGKGGIRKCKDGLLEGDSVTYSVNYPYDGAGTYFSGGAGLVSTSGDYCKFLMNLLFKGHGRTTHSPLNSLLLSPKSIELMTTVHTGDFEIPFRGPGYGFGLGFAILRDPGKAGELGTEGAYDWGGFFSTTFWVDPEEGLIGILMTQKYPGGGMDLLNKFKVLTYQAIAE